MQSMNIHKDTLILSSGVAGDQLKHMKPLGSTRKKSMKRLEILSSEQGVSSTLNKTHVCTLRKYI